MSGSIAACPSADPERPRRRLIHLVIVPVCRYLLAAVFLAAAVTKLTDLPGFRDRLVLHSGLPARLADATAVSLPWLELTCALCLVIGLARREAAVLLAGLLVIFLVHALAVSGGSECGCFLLPQAWEPAARPWLFVRNGGLFFAAVYLAAADCDRSATKL